MSALIYRCADQDIYDQSEQYRDEYIIVEHPDIEKHKIKSVCNKNIKRDLTQARQSFRDPVDPGKIITQGYIEYAACRCCYHAYREEGKTFAVYLEV